MRRLALTSAVLAALAAVAFAAMALASNAPKLVPKMKTKRVIATQDFTIQGSDAPERYEVYCPRGMRPLGGGVFASPPPDATGAGAFPVSYERLGQQDGWHISVAQVGKPTGTPVKLQVMCRKYSGNIDPVEHFVKDQTTKNVGPGETKRFTETCPGKGRIITGGYLSSHFFSNKGVFVTESMMTPDQKSWTILAHGVAGGTGGQVTSIAYCYKSKKPLLAETRGAPATATATATATSTAPPCPGGKQLIAGGYSAPGTVRVFDGGFRDLNTWTASASHYTAPGEVTAIGYCL